MLYDSETRAIYDKYGEEGLARGGAGKPHWREAWDEFKPFVKKSRKRDARDGAPSPAEDTAGPSSPDCIDRVYVALSTGDMRVRKPRSFRTV